MVFIVLYDSAWDGNSIGRNPAPRSDKTDVSRQSEGPDFLQDRNLRWYRSRRWLRCHIRGGGGRSPQAFLGTRKYAK